MNKKLHQELNKQINTELQSGYLYLAMAAYLESRSLDGFAHWMKLQAQEELAHATKIYRYLLDVGEKVTLLAIDEPESQFSSVLKCFELSLKNEQELGERFNTLSGIALDARDNTTYTFLEWFLTEQVEEVATVSVIVEKLRLIGDDGNGLLMLNNELRLRTLSAVP